MRDKAINKEFVIACDWSKESTNHPLTEQFAPTSSMRSHHCGALCFHHDSPARRYSTMRVPSSSGIDKNDEIDQNNEGEEVDVADEDHDDFGEEGDEAWQGRIQQ